jgi:hypothetical protein
LVGDRGETRSRSTTDRFSNGEVILCETRIQKSDRDWDGKIDDPIDVIRSLRIYSRTDVGRIAQELGISRDICPPQSHPQDSRAYYKYGRPYLQGNHPDFDSKRDVKRENDRKNKPGDTNHE